MFGLFRVQGFEKPPVQAPLAFPNRTCKELDMGLGIPSSGFRGGLSVKGGGSCTLSNLTGSGVLARFYTGVQGGAP